MSSKFITLGGMVVMAAAESASGARVELVERPIGSTVGVRYVRHLQDGQGISTEQFSGARASLADGAFIALAQQHGAELVAVATPKAEPKAPKAPKAKAPKAAAGEEVVFEAGDVRVIKVSGKPTLLRTECAGATVATVECAPQSWRKAQEAAIAKAKAL